MLKQLESNFLAPSCPPMIPGEWLLPSRWAGYGVNYTGEELIPNEGGCVDFPQLALTSKSSASIKRSYQGREVGATPRAPSA